MWEPLKLAYDWGITIHKPAILGYLGYVLTHSHIHRIIMGHKMVKSPMNGSCYKKYDESSWKSPAAFNASSLISFCSSGINTLMSW
jgi:hypothetical protein